MVAQGDIAVGRFYVEIELANNRDVTTAELGLTPESDVRRVKIQALVDTGATRLVIPQSTADQLGLKGKGQVKVRYANNEPGTREHVENVYLELMGRHSVFNAIVEPKRDTALIGAIVLEDLDFLFDCVKGRLYPRDPDSVVSEIE